VCPEAGQPLPKAGGEGGRLEAEWRPEGWKTTRCEARREVFRAQIAGNHPVTGYYFVVIIIFRIRELVSFLYWHRDICVQRPPEALFSGQAGRRPLYLYLYLFS
jgi:hypothetical protein